MPVDTHPRGCLGIPPLSAWGFHSPVLTARNKKVQNHTRPPSMSLVPNKMAFSVPRAQPAALGSSSVLALSHRSADPAPERSPGQEELRLSLPRGSVALGPLLLLRGPFPWLLLLGDGHHQEPVLGPERLACVGSPLHPGATGQDRQPGSTHPPARYLLGPWASGSCGGEEMGTVPGASRQSVNKEPGGRCELVRFPLLSPWLWSQHVASAGLGQFGESQRRGHFVGICV